MRKNVFQVGVAKRDITPEIGVNLVGGVAPYPSDGIATRPYIKVLAVKGADDVFLFVTFDNLKYPDALDAVSAIAAETGIDEKHILVTASHAHSCPWYEDYGDSIIVNMLSASKEALADMSPCTLLLASAKLENMTHNRRVIKDGTCWNTWLLPKEERLNYPPAAAHDTQVLTLAAKDESGRYKALLFNFACHACTSGATPTLISADYPGYTRIYLDEALGYPTETLFWPGACGDVNGLRDAKTIGKEMANVIVGSLSNAKTVKSNEMKVMQIWLDLTDRNEQEFKKEDVEEIWANEVEHFRECYQEAVDARKDVYHCPLTAIRIGPDFAIVTSPTEMFSEIGLQIKSASPFETTFVVEQTNGALGYLPTDKAYRQGGYETFYGEHSFLEKDAANKIFRASMALLDSVKNK